VRLQEQEPAPLAAAAWEMTVGPSVGRRLLAQAERNGLRLLYGNLPCASSCS
jgi:hypothetical protein